MFKCNAVLSNPKPLEGLEIINATNQSISVSYSGLVINCGSCYSNSDLTFKRKIDNPDEFHDIIDIYELDSTFPNSSLCRNKYNKDKINFIYTIKTLSIGQNCGSKEYYEFLDTVLSILEEKLSKALSNCHVVKVENTINDRYYKNLSFIERKIDDLKEIFGFKTKKSNYLEDKYFINILNVKLSVIIPNAIRKARTLIPTEQRKLLDCLNVATIFLISSPFFNIKDSDLIEIYI